jgi:hypothetical protein
MLRSLLQNYDFFFFFIKGGSRNGDMAFLPLYQVQIKFYYKNLGSSNFVYLFIYSIYFAIAALDRLSGLVVRVPGYRSTGPGFDFRSYQIFWEVMGLELGPLSLVKITEELLERIVAAPV